MSRIQNALAFVPPRSAAFLRRSTGGYMVNNINQLFHLVNRGFLETYVMSAIGIEVMAPGPSAFNLQSHELGKQKAAQLGGWQPNSGQRPIHGYWVPQGDSCLISAQPGIKEYVFTADFSGCSIVVDQIDANNYRVYHVTGGRNRLAQEYSNGRHGHGLGVAASMTFDEYGDAGAPCGFAFLRFEQGRWWIYYQRQTGAQLGIQKAGGKTTLLAPGGKTIIGGGRIPVADLTREVPRMYASHGGLGGDPLPVPPMTPQRRRMLPNDELW
jgi:hypothetical protein